MDYNNASAIYTIEVSEEEVSICGQLTIEEAFDFINFFDRKGYKYINEGYHSSLLLTKKSILQKKEECMQINENLSEGMFERLYVQSQQKVTELKDLLKKIIITPGCDLLQINEQYKGMKDELEQRETDKQ